MDQVGGEKYLIGNACTLGAEVCLLPAGNRNRGTASSYRSISSFDIATLPTRMYGRTRNSWRPLHDFWVCERGEKVLSPHGLRTFENYGPNLMSSNVILISSSFQE